MTNEKVIFWHKSICVHPPGPVLTSPPQHQPGRLQIISCERTDEITGEIKTTPVLKLDLFLPKTRTVLYLIYFFFPKISLWCPKNIQECSSPKPQGSRPKPSESIVNYIHEITSNAEDRPWDECFTIDESHQEEFKNIQEPQKFENKFTLSSHYAAMNSNSETISVISSEEILSQNCDFDDNTEKINKMIHDGALDISKSNQTETIEVHLDLLRSVRAYFNLGGSLDNSDIELNYDDELLPRNDCGQLVLYSRDSYAKFSSNSKP